MRSPENKTKPPAPIDELDHKSLISGEFWKKLQPYAHVDESFPGSFVAGKKFHYQHRETASCTVQSGFERISRRRQTWFAAIVYEHANLALFDQPHRLGQSLCRSTPAPIHPFSDSLLRDHPKLTMDPLSELVDSPVPGLTHRYADKALFLALDSCPVYCRFCTRSYSVGNDTETVDKIQLHEI